MGVLQRYVESSPAIVAVISVFSYVIWREWRRERTELLAQWRQERAELLKELSEERSARAVSHREIVLLAEKSTEAVHAVREALSQLRTAIDKQRP